MSLVRQVDPDPGQPCVAFWKHGCSWMILSGVQWDPDEFWGAVALVALWRSAGRGEARALTVEARLGWAGERRTMGETWGQGRAGLS